MNSDRQVLCEAVLRQIVSDLVYDSDVVTLEDFAVEVRRRLEVSGLEFPRTPKVQGLLASIATRFFLAIEYRKAKP